MKNIEGQNRAQIYLFPVSLDEAIYSNNEVRLIDVFVGSLNIGKLGFKLDFGENGRPAYHPADLLKLYIYGYLNRVRSSRRLEKECKRNIEVMWLLNSLAGRELAFWIPTELTGRARTYTRTRGWNYLHHASGG